MANSKKVSVFILFILFGISDFHTVAFRLNQNTGENGRKSISSPFGATVQLSKFASRYNQIEPKDDQLQASSPPPSSQQCPEMMFTCKSTSVTAEKNNDLFQQSRRQQKPFFCIDKSRLCDGQSDCPDGEDENELNCPIVIKGSTDLSLVSSETAIAEAGCYLCKASGSFQSPNCISLSLLCNGHTDCPLADDEHVEMCSNQPNNYSNKHHPQSIASGTSSFSTNQFSPTNITIVNSVPKDEPYFGDHQQENQQPAEVPLPPSTTRDLPKGSVQADLGSSKAGVHNGVGFMFRVDNLVIYNSQVKMFNQNSENIAPADEEARQNATGGGYQHQQSNLNDFN